MTQKVFFAKTNMENRINRGELVVAYNEDELDLPAFSVLAALVGLEAASFYHVGYKMGEILTSLRHILPDSKLGGAELEELYAAYSHKIFNNKNSNINFQTINYLEDKTSDRYEVVFGNGILSNHSVTDQKRIVDNMLASSTKYVVLAEPVSQEIVDYISNKGHNVQTNDELTIVVKVEKKKDEPKQDTKDK